MARPVGHGLALDRVSLGAHGRRPWALLDAAGQLLAVYEATDTDRIRRPSCVAAQLTGGLVSERWRCSARHCCRRSGLGRHHRRLRRRPPRATATCSRELSAQAADARALDASWSPSTATRPPSSGPSRPRAAHRPRPEARALAACGVDRTLVVPFDEARADETAEDFVAEVLVGALGARLVVVGEDFHFGHGRKGNVALLREMGRALRLRGRSACALTGDGGEAVSSTRIRHAGGRGDVAGAAALLGRPHQVRGGWSTATAGVAPSSASRPPTWLCRPDRPARRRHLRRLLQAARRVGPPGRRLGRAADPPSTSPATAPAWSRPSCSTSTATSTASRPGSPSWPASGTSALRVIDALVAQMDRDVAAGRAALPTARALGRAGRRLLGC